MKKDNNLLFKKYTFWSVKPEKLNISDPWTRKWYLKQVLTYGRLEDIACLDFEEIKNSLDELNLPKEIDRLWRHYFAEQKVTASLNSASKRIS